MPTVEQIRTAIGATLADIAGVGQVHDYERYSKNMADFAALYRTTVGGVAQIRGWNIRRLSRRALSTDLGRTIVTTTWRLNAYMSLDDAAESEKAFDTLVDAAVAAFKQDETLGGVVDATVVADVAGLQVEDAGPVMFGGVLCHAARCTLLTQHFED
jgi:hypothetical protein